MTLNYNASFCCGGGLGYWDSVVSLLRLKRLYVRLAYLDRVSRYSSLAD
jgi:hypothetical protein